MAFVSDYINRRIAPGQTFTIYGGFIDGSCSVFVGDNEATIVDYDEDYIEVLAPDEIGDYAVTMTDGDGVSHKVGDIAVVALADTPKRFAPVAYTADDFKSYVKGLLPRGNALALWNGSNFGKLITGLANAFKYTWDTIREMVDSVDPTHTENLEKWEGELNLPVLGIYPTTDAGRRSEIYRVECTNGGCTKDYYRRLLSLMGKDAEIYEYTQNPEMFAAIDFGNDDPRFFFMVKFWIAKDKMTTFNAGESCAGDYLLGFANFAEEKVFNDAKPSHTKIIFSYEKSVVTIGDYEYPYKKIGGLLWTTENLKEDVGTNSFYNKDETTYGKYGRLYEVNDEDTHTAIEALLSDGWRIPTIADYSALLGLASLTDTSSSCAVGEWKTSSGSSIETTNKNGFTAIPSGTKNYGFYGIGYLASFITQTKESSDTYYGIQFINGKWTKTQYQGSNLQFSVRLCKDA